MKIDMKTTSLLYVASVMIVIMFVTVSCVNLNSNNKNNMAEGISPEVASFDYYRYEGKDPWFDKKIDAGSQYFNPVIAGYYPDPSICRKGDTYYLVNSSFGFFPGVPIFTSDDLVNWKQIGHVLDRPSQLNLDGLDISQGIYAPAIEYNSYNDTFYMVTTNVGGIGNFFVKTKDPLKGWSDPILLPEVKNIDPSFFFDEDGKAYIVHNDAPEGEPEWHQQRTIRIHEFDVENDRTIGKSKEIVRGGVNPKDKPIWIEGPHLYKINGYYYLMCAEGGTADMHSEVIFRSKSPWGPYEPANYNPILTQRDLSTERSKKISCTGHADIIRTPNGEWWAVFLAVRPYEGEYMFNTGRETYMLPVEWENGFPIIQRKGKPIPTIVNKKNLSPRKNLYLTGNFVYNQPFDNAELDHSWIQIRTPKKEFYTIKDGKLYITPLSVSIQEKESPAVVLRRQQHTNFAVETQLEYTPKTEHDFAGMTLFQNEAYQFLFGKTIVEGKESLVVYRIEKNIETVACISLNKNEIKLPIKLKVEGKAGQCDFLYSLDGINWQTILLNADATNLSTQKAGGFIGTCIGLYATSNHLSQ